MFRGNIRVFLLAVVDGRLKMRNPLLRVGVILCLLCFFSVRERSFRMGHEDISVAHFAMVNSFFGMADCFGQVILGECETWRQDACDAQAEAQNKNSAIYTDPPEWF